MTDLIEKYRPQTTDHHPPPSGTDTPPHESTYLLLHRGSLAAAHIPQNPSSLSFVGSVVVVVVPVAVAVAVAVAAVVAVLVVVPRWCSPRRSKLERAVDEGLLLGEPSRGRFEALRESTQG